MKILLTGSAGFIGFHLAKSLLSNGFHVLGIDNLNSYYSVELKKKRLKELRKFKNFKFIRCDIKNSLKIKEDNFDVAINLAAQAGVRLQIEDFDKYINSNIIGCHNFFELCRSRNIKNIIQASSSSVYGDVQKPPFRENNILDPKSTYALSKLYNEKISEFYSKNFNLKVHCLRFFTVYGSWGRPDMAYFLFSKMIKNNEKIILFNKGKGARDMTHVSDIVSGINLSISKLLDLKQNCFEIYNLGNEKPIMTKQLLERIERKLKKKAKIIHKNSMNESELTHASINKSKKELGYNPLVSFEEGLDEFFFWFNNHC